ncbi:hypothetical protein ACNQFZ_21215 [Schinkia sp. CFF1]
MYLLTSSSVVGINLGDIIFQLLSFFIGIAIPIIFIVLFFANKNKRLKRIEEKLDTLLERKDKF